MQEVIDIMEIGEDISIDVDQQIIMKTARICIKNPKNGQYEYGMALLDTGAKHTYITAKRRRI